MPKRHRFARKKPVAVHAQKLRNKSKPKSKKGMLKSVVAEDKKVERKRNLKKKRLSDKANPQNVNTKDAFAERLGGLKLLVSPHHLAKLKHQKFQKLQAKKAKKQKNEPITDDIDMSEPTELKEDLVMKVSHIPATFEPGTTVELKERASERWWRVPNEGHTLSNSVFEPRQEGFTSSIIKKQSYHKMKDLESQLFDEIRDEKRKEREKREERKKIKEDNQMRGTIYVPIRNMSKIKKMTRKQKQSIMKWSVKMKTPKEKQVRVRSAVVSHQL